MHLSYHRLYRIISLGDFVSRHASLSGESRILLEKHSSAGLISNSRCIYNNLAAEEALLRGVIFSPRQQCLLLYVNKPCVVIGRNQNVLQEIAVRSARRDGVAIARRTSGGGAVYHDTGNLCLSFFTHREGYKPHKTIQILRHFLSAYCGIPKDRLSTTARHDLFLDGKKITGSAMRVQRDVAYHHCTLLVHSCREALGTYLKSEGVYDSFKTAAVGSVRSPVTTLASENIMPPAASTIEDIQHALMDYFINAASEILAHNAPWEMETPALRTEHSFDKERTNCSVFELDVRSAVTNNEKMKDGEGRRAPAGSSTGVGEEAKRLQSVDWFFSMPKFETNISIDAETIKRVCKELLPNEVAELTSGYSSISITTVVDRRYVTKLEVHFTDTSGATQSCWCEKILRTFIEGVLVDAAPTSLDDNAVLSAAIQFEFQELLESLGANGNVAISLFIRSVLSIWWEKNAFY